MALEYNTLGGNKYNTPNTLQKTNQQTNKYNTLLN